MWTIVNHVQLGMLAGRFMPVTVIVDGSFTQPNPSNMLLHRLNEVTVTKGRFRVASIARSHVFRACPVHVQTCLKADRPTPAWSSLSPKEGRWTQARGQDIILVVFQSSTAAMGQVSHCHYRRSLFIRAGEKLKALALSGSLSILSDRCALCLWVR